MPRTSRSQSVSSTMLDRLKVRDEGAWRRLVEVFGPVVYQWCRRASLQPSDAADAVQEVFQSVSTALGNFRRSRPNDTFRGWLWTITRNKIQDQFRRLHRRPVAVGGTEARQRIEQEAALDSVDSEQSCAEDGERFLVRRALALIRTDFDPTTWQAFSAMVVEERASAEIADELGMTGAAVRQAKCRVIRRLREEIARLRQELDGLL